MRPFKLEIGNRKQKRGMSIKGTTDSHKYFEKEESEKVRR
jgi:hypothetical protein